MHRNYAIIKVLIKERLIRTFIIVDVILLRLCKITLAIMDYMEHLFYC